MKSKSEFNVLIVYPNLPLMLVPSIAIGLFAGILKRQGYKVDLFETTYYDTTETNFSELKINISENRISLLNVRKFDPQKDLGIEVKINMLDHFREKILEFKPDALIFSVVEDTYLQTLSMLAAIEDLDLPSIIGGVFPTMAPEIAIQGKNINLIGLGEGERTVVNFCEAVRQGNGLRNIPGTWFKCEDGAIQKNSQLPLVDLEDEVPDYSLLDKSRFNRPMGGRVFRMMPVESYRGCPFSCTYCNSPAQYRLAKVNGIGNFLRRSRIEKLRDYLRTLRDAYNPEFFFFVDDSFLARPRHEIFEFCDMYEEFNLPFYFNTRTESCDTEILTRLKEINCYRIAFGIECGNEQFRKKVLRRQIRNKEIVRRFEMIADSGIPFSLNVIIGMPGETRDLVFDTIELVRSIRGYDTLTSFVFTPYHGTPLREVAVANGWLDTNTITKHNTSRSLLNMPPPYMNADEMDGLLMTIPLYCYFPKSEWSNLRRAELQDEEGLRIRKHYADIYSRDFLRENHFEKKIFPANDDRPIGVPIGDDFRSNIDRMDAFELERLTRPMENL